ncbi:MAG: LPS export ABC transporter periplasmic protein LptC [Candidatus Omnitrophota bacterium]
MEKNIAVISILIFAFISLTGNFLPVYPNELEQTVNGFTLYGFGDTGQKTWEVFGKTADVFSDQIRLNDLIGTIYGEEEIVLTAERGNFNKAQNAVHLEENVIITTESGAKLTTDYLDWDNNTSLVTTDAPVDIKRDNITTTGIGIKGNTNLESIDLKKDVKVVINDKKGTVVVTCSGPLSIDYAANIAVFNNDVVVDDGESRMYADSMEVFFDTAPSDNKTDKSLAGKRGKINKIIARDNVKIIRQDNVSFSDQAVYNAEDKTVTLIGKPRLIIYSAPQKM